ncbi:MAG TPA: hypothetical protein VJX95_03375 [Oscillospiraceae bacterium]|nr:hypothetical protein [Oscillospiraceae bacterium]
MKLYRFTALVIIMIIIMTMLSACHVVTENFDDYDDEDITYAVP